MYPSSVPSHIVGWEIPSSAATPAPGGPITGTWPITALLAAADDIVHAAEALVSAAPASLSAALPAEAPFSAALAGGTAPALAALGLASLSASGGRESASVDAAASPASSSESLDELKQSDLIKP